MGENCRSGCRTKDHANWGECARASRITVTPVDVHAKKIDHELTSYADARRQGIQPAGTRLAQTEAAVQASQAAGAAWDASNNTFKGE
jgi:crotonobetainyl-CoA:carnitine CoA-transferase CaiB-like acyl-CoA transferase